MYENQEQDVAAKIKAAIDREKQQYVGERVPMENAEMAMQAGVAPSKPYLAGTAGARSYTRADMHEKAAASEQLSAQRNASAAAFLRSYPQFETFLDLIRDGAITLY